MRITTSIKLRRLASLRPESRYPETWRAITRQIPPDLLRNLTARQLADVVGAMQSAHQAGKITERTD